MSNFFNINNIYNINSAKVRSTINGLKNGNAEERKLYEFMAKKSDADHDGKLDINEITAFLASADKSNDNKISNSKISDAELVELFGKKNSKLKDTFKGILDGFTSLAKSSGTKSNTAGKKTEEALKKGLQSFIKNNSLSDTATFDKVKDNDSKPKNTFNGIEYAKSMTADCGNGTKVVVYCDANGNVIGYNKIKCDKDNNRTSKVSYTQDGVKLAKTTYDKGEVATRQTYDKQGHVDSKSTYDKNGKLATKEVYELDENGKSYTSRKKTYKNGVISTSVHLDANGKEVKKLAYDKNGNIKNSEIYAYDEKGNKYVSKKNKYECDKNGNIKNRETYSLDKESGKFVLSSKTSYVTKNNISRPAKTEIYFPGTKILKEERSYDSRGVMSKSIKYNNDDEHSVKSTTYYKDGVKTEAPKPTLADIMAKLRAGNFTLKGLQELMAMFRELAGITG